MNRVYRWVEFMDILLANYLSPALIEAAENQIKKTIEQLENGEYDNDLTPDYEPSDGPNMELEWVEWQCKYGGCGKDFSCSAITEIIDVEFLKYDDLTRRSIVKRIFRKLNLALDEYDPDTKTDDKYIQHRYLYDNAFDEVYWFVVEIIDIAEDYGINYRSLNLKNIDKIERLLDWFEIREEAALSRSLSDVINCSDRPKIIKFICENYRSAKGKEVAILILSLKSLGLLSLNNRTDFYRAFLQDLGRSDRLESFRKGVDKYLCEQGKSNNPEWLTVAIKKSDIVPIVDRLSSQK